METSQLLLPSCYVAKTFMGQFGATIFIKTKYGCFWKDNHTSCPNCPNIICSKKGVAAWNFSSKLLLIPTCVRFCAMLFEIKVFAQTYYTIVANNDKVLPQMCEVGGFNDRRHFLASICGPKRTSFSNCF